MHKIVASWNFGSAMACALAAPLLSLFTIESAETADKVGVAAAVKPEATSQPPGGETTTLKIGKSVLYNERIDTSGSGVLQVLLIDGSTFTVGPGSSLVIDKFVYNPGTGKGSLVASFSKGALRYVGGKLSKQEQGIAIKTPAGALTVRGGITLMKVNGPNRLAAACVFGEFLALKRNGVLDKVRPDNMFVVSGPGPAVKRATTAADINSLLAAVSGQKTKLAGKAVKGKPWPYYYGIQPTGTYPDQPPIRELYYDGATTGLLINGLKRVPIPTPEVRVPVTPPVTPPQQPPVPQTPLTNGPNLR